MRKSNRPELLPADERAEGLTGKAAGAAHRIEPRPLPLLILPEIEILEAAEAELEPLYRVIIHNDDLTPMEFVVTVLKTIFYLSNPKAAEIMLSAHFYGSAYVQTLPRPEAQRRIDRAHSASDAEGYPLRFTIEPE
jgi:ATP-dependent Clp protease adaptor protein ClpS